MRIGFAVSASSAQRQLPLRATQRDLFLHNEERAPKRRTHR